MTEPDFEKEANHWLFEHEYDQEMASDVPELAALLRRMYELGKQHGRTPGTVEVCSRCRSENDFRFSNCTDSFCPIKRKETNE